MVFKELTDIFCVLDILLEYNNDRSTFLPPCIIVLQVKHDLDGANTKQLGTQWLAFKNIMSGFHLSELFHQISIFQKFAFVIRTPPSIYALFLP